MKIFEPTYRQIRKICYPLAVGILILSCALCMSRKTFLGEDNGNQASAARSGTGDFKDRLSNLFGRNSSKLNRNASESSKKQLPKPPSFKNAGFVTISAPLDSRKTKALLEKEGYDPELLSSALLLCNDPEQLSKAKEAAQNHGVVAAVLSMSGSTPQAKLDFASLLIKNEPGNILGYLASAEALFQMGDKEKAWSFIEQSKAVENMETFASQLSRGQDRVFMESGYDTVERGLLAGKNEWNEKILSFLGGLSDHVLDGAEGNVAAERASWLLNTIDQFKLGMKDEMLMGQASRLDNLEALALRNLPAGSQMVDGGTVEERADQIAFEYSEMIRRNRSIGDILDRSTYKVAEEYYQRVFTDGEKSASVWLIGE